MSAVFNKILHFYLHMSEICCIFAAAKYNGVPNGRQQSASGGESVAHGESSYDRFIGNRTEPKSKRRTFARQTRADRKNIKAKTTEYYGRDRKNKSYRTILQNTSQ